MMGAHAPSFSMLRAWCPCGYDIHHSLGPLSILVRISQGSDALNGVATGCCQPCALKPERHLSRNIQEKKRLTGWWHPVVAAASRRRISAAGRRSYAANVNATFYE